MEKKKFFKNRLQMIIYIILFCICIFLFILIGKNPPQKKEGTDAYKFSKLYDKVPENNVYTFTNSSNVLDILKSRSGIILLGFPSNKWTNEYALILNNVAKELNIKTIYYYDFRKDRSESNGTYETIVNKLANYIPTDDEGVQDIQAPTVLIVSKGNLIGYFDEMTYMRGNLSPESYYNEVKKNEIYENFKNVLINYSE